MANEDKMQTLAGAIIEMASRGFTQPLKVVDGTRLAVIGAGKSFAAAEVIVREHRRFEGVSDPDDASVLYAIEARDGTKGVLTDAYGAYADPIVAEFLGPVAVDQPAVRDPQVTSPAYERVAG